MTNRSQHLDRDQVLLAFHEAYEKPTAENIIEWVKQYPEYAEDIQDHAAIAHDIAAREAKHMDDDIDERTLNISFSHALNGLYAGDQQSKISSNHSSATSFQELIAALGKSIATLADAVGGTVGIARSIVSDLVGGGMKPPIGRRLKEAMMRELSITSASFDGKVQYSLDHPQLGMANSSVTPIRKQRSYEEIIKASSMDQTQKKYWLSED